MIVRLPPCQRHQGRLLWQRQMPRVPRRSYVAPDFERLAVDLLASLCAKFPLGYRPELIWKQLRVTAGLAYFKTGEIALSSLLLTDEERVRSTLIHEYAHLLAVARHGRKAAGHGKAWRQAMIDLGEEPTVRHCYPVERNRARQSVGYVCSKCGQTLVRSRRLPRRRQYVHAACGGPIKFAWARTATIEQDEP